MEPLSIAVNNLSIDFFSTLPITHIAYSIVSQLLEDGEVVSVSETSNPIKDGCIWHCIYVTIKRADDGITLVTFVRDDCTDLVYSLESIDTFQN